MTKIEFGKWVYETRLVKGYSLRGLASVTGVSHAHIHKVEKGQTGVSADFCRKLSAAFGVDQSTILRYAGLLGNSSINNTDDLLLVDEISNRVKGYSLRQRKFLLGLMDVMENQFLDAV